VSCSRLLACAQARAAGGAEKKLAESELAEGRMWFHPLSSGFLFAPSSTKEPVHRLTLIWRLTPEGPSFLFLGPSVVKDVPAKIFQWIVR